MESDVITLSQAADLIIVVCFGAVGYFAFLYFIAEGICGLIDFIRSKRKARKEWKAMKREQEQAKE